MIRLGRILSALMVVSGPWATVAEESGSADHWAFQKIARPVVPDPAGRSWGRNAIDHFVLARLEERGLRASGPAAKAEFIRRASFDFLGLPPTPEEVEAFVNDASEDASEKLIDRLLASPRFGERWGRHWLDVVRFAQTNGYEYDEEKPQAWRYRDWVIGAFNDDMPYDQFVRQQLAGDELDEVTDGSLTATGFYRIGPWDKEPDDERQSEFDGLDDMLSTASSAFLGITMGCARCHDHPSDPFSQADYYGMLAFLRGVKPYTAKKDEMKHSILAPLPGGGETLAVREHGTNAPETFVLGRGDPGTPEAKVEPAFPAVLCGGSPAAPKIAKGESTSGRRRALAEWVTSPDHPLTARVIVNRLWHYHFGRGLVATPNDFGRAGMKPTDPELLDWLAAELMENGWSLKHIHRLIGTSATYGQRSNPARRQEGDPENRFLWRQNLRRLEAEAIRDAILAANGSLNVEAMGGRGFFAKLHPEVILGSSAPGRGWEKSQVEERRRRSVYAYAMRNMVPSLMEDFDCASQEHSTAVRQVTTVAPQALNLLNGEFVREASRVFAARLMREGPGDPVAQIRLAYRYALGRFPTGREVVIGRAYLQRQRESFGKLPDAIRIRPDVSPTMFKAYRDKNSAEDYFVGPRDKWRYYRGFWFEGMAENLTVVPKRGPFALWEGFELGEAARMEGRLQFDDQLEVAAVIMPAQAKGDLFHGYEVQFDPRRGKISLVKLADQIEVLATSGLSIEKGEWLEVRVDYRAGRFRVWRGNDEIPLIDEEDRSPLPPQGHFGIRCWGGELRLDGVRLTSGEHRVEIRPDPTDETPEDRALAAFCNLIYNLNEFVYVD